MVRNPTNERKLKRKYLLDFRKSYLLHRILFKKIEDLRHTGLYDDIFSSYEWLHLSGV